MLSFVRLLVAGIGTVVSIMLGKWVLGLCGVLVVPVGWWEFRAAIQPWREEDMVVATLVKLGGRATEDKLEAALFAAVSDGSIYEDERMEDLRLALLRLLERGRIAVDGEELCVV